MSKQRQTKLNWKSVLGAIALVVGSGAIAFPAQATPDWETESFKLAQVRSRVNPPTPLNLRPRTHTPLPTTRGSRGYYHRSGYGSRSRRLYGGYNRHDSDYGYRHDRDYRRDRHQRDKGGTVIIINPANSRSSNHRGYNRQGSYIRIIGK